MNVNILLNPDAPPSRDDVGAALGASAPYFDALLGLTAAYTQEWKHYGAKYGWKLKVHADSKTLVEVTIADGWLLASLALRAPEHQALRDGPTASIMAALLDGDAGASEGYGLKIDVRDQGSYDKLAALLNPVMAMRATG